MVADLVVIFGSFAACIAFIYFLMRQRNERLAIFDAEQKSEASSRAEDVNSTGLGGLIFELPVNGKMLPVHSIIAGKQYYAMLPVGPVKVSAYKIRVPKDSSQRTAYLSSASYEVIAQFNGNYFSSAFTERADIPSAAWQVADFHQVVPGSNPVWYSSGRSTIKPNFAVTRGSTQDLLEEFYAFEDLIDLAFFCYVMFGFEESEYLNTDFGPPAEGMYEGLEPFEEAVQAEVQEPEQIESEPKQIVEPAAEQTEPEPEQPVEAPPIQQVQEEPSLPERAECCGGGGCNSSPSDELEIETRRIEATQSAGWSVSGGGGGGGGGFSDSGDSGGSFDSGDCGGDD